jgi:hypothetical protein
MNETGENMIEQLSKFNAIVGQLFDVLKGCYSLTFYTDHVSIQGKFGGEVVKKHKDNYHLYISNNGYVEGDATVGECMVHLVFTE